MYVVVLYKKIFLPALETDVVNRFINHDTLQKRLSFMLKKSIKMPTSI